jgi:hypothetical protein
MKCEECGGSLDLESDDPCICESSKELMKQLGWDED